jgi:HK97 gp10 family phage protein
MVTPTVEVKGLRELQRKFERITRELSKNPVMQAIAKATLLVQRDAKKNAPVDTGRLRASIMPDIVTRDTIVQGLVGSNVEYAPYQEFGTRRGVPAVRYLQRALNDNARRIAQLLRTTIAGVIKRQGD